jgi:hypothetical protein
MIQVCNAEQVDLKPSVLITMWKLGDLALALFGRVSAEIKKYKLQNGHCLAEKPARATTATRVSYNAARSHTLSLLTSKAAHRPFSPGS